MRILAALALSLPLLAGPPAKEYLPGKRLILAGAMCAGWAFRSADRAARYDELMCRSSGEPTLEARIVWVTPDRFLLVEERGAGAAGTCPPRTWMFEAVEVGPKQVVLQETWLGWGARKGRPVPEAYRVAKLPD